MKKYYRYIASVIVVCLLTSCYGPSSMVTYRGNDYWGKSRYDGRYCDAYNGVTFNPDGTVVWVGDLEP